VLFRNLNQRFGWNAEAFVQLPNHPQRQRSLAIEHLIDAISAADVTNEVTRLKALRMLRSAAYIGSIVTENAARRCSDPLLRLSIAPILLPGRRPPNPEIDEAYLFRQAPGVHVSQID
jgi:hypothetical protein